MADRRPWIVTTGGLMLDVRLTPKGGRDAIDGIERLADGRPVLKARVRAVPADGQANAALIALLADRLRIPARRIALSAGATARIKRIAIEGDGAALAAMLEKLARPG